MMPLAMAAMSAMGKGGGGGGSKKPTEGDKAAERLNSLVSNIQSSNANVKSDISSIPSPKSTLPEDQLAKLKAYEAPTTNSSGMERPPELPPMLAQSGVTSPSSPAKVEESKLPGKEEGSYLNKGMETIQDGMEKVGSILGKPAEYLSKGVNAVTDLIGKPLGELDKQLSEAIKNKKEEDRVAENARLAEQNEMQSEVEEQRKIAQSTPLAFSESGDTGEGSGKKKSFLSFSSGKGASKLF